MVPKHKMQRIKIHTNIAVVSIHVDCVNPSNIQKK
jgi:hypothetical protein